MRLLHAGMCSERAGILLFLTQFSRNIKPAISAQLGKVPLTKLSHPRWEITLGDESARRGSFPPSSLTDTSSPANKSHDRRARGDFAGLAAGELVSRFVYSRFHHPASDAKTGTQRRFEAET